MPEGNRRLQALQHSVSWRLQPDVADQAGPAVTQLQLPQPLLALHVKVIELPLRFTPSTHTFQCF
jgi:hypothetical protein